jgi:hypothetical protein
MAFSRLILVSLTVLLLAGSCRRADRDYDNSLLATQDQVLMDQLTFDLFIMIDEACRYKWGTIPALTTGKLNGGTLNSNLSSYPRSVSISFGSGTTTSDGRYRQGSVVVQVYGEYGTPGTQVVVTTSGYVVDQYDFTANHTINCNGPDGSGNDVFSFSYSNLGLTDSINRVLSYTGTRTRTRTSGALTLQVDDDVFSISGTSSGRSRSGNTFSTKCTSPLVQAANCRYVISGTMKVEPNNLAMRYVDFGQNCDSNVTVTINNTLYYLAQD